MQDTGVEFTQVPLSAPHTSNLQVIFLRCSHLLGKSRWRNHALQERWGFVPASLFWTSFLAFDSTETIPPRLAKPLLKSEADRKIDKMSGNIHPALCFTVPRFGCNGHCSAGFMDTVTWGHQHHERSWPFATQHAPSSFVAGHSWVDKWCSWCFSSKFCFPPVLVSLSPSLSTSLCCFACHPPCRWKSLA